MTKVLEAPEASPLHDGFLRTLSGAQSPDQTVIGGSSWWWEEWCGFRDKRARAEHLPCRGRLDLPKLPEYPQKLRPGGCAQSRIPDSPISRLH